ncbi:MAG: hypothetical protein VX683_04260 [Cyanobacteriota bacterium]|nr:hypothetical protein [Cyanobacteriota bacterium]
MNNINAINLNTPFAIADFCPIARGVSATVIEDKLWLDAKAIAAALDLSAHDINIRYFLPQCDWQTDAEGEDLVSEAGLYKLLFLKTTDEAVSFCNWTIENVMSFWLRITGDMELVPAFQALDIEEHERESHHIIALEQVASELLPLIRTEPTSFIDEGFTLLA